MKQAKQQITEKNITQFEKLLIKNEKSQNTIDKYIRDIRKFQKYLNNKHLTKEIVISYRKDMEHSGQYQINSINSYLVSLNQFFQYMGWQELCVKTIKVQRTIFEAEEKELTMDEYRRLVEAAIKMEDGTTALIMQTIASTGIRIGELRYICVESLEQGVIDVHNKGKVRRILLPSDLIPLLMEYAEKENRTTGTIFCNHKGNPLDRKTIWRNMKKAAVLAEVPEEKVFPHNLRHLFAKKFYQQTGDIMKLADILGHSNVNTTRIYIRTAGSEHKKQLDAMRMIIMENKTNNGINEETNTDKLNNLKEQNIEENVQVLTTGDTIIINNLSEICLNGITYEITIKKRSA